MSESQFSERHSHSGVHKTAVKPLLHFKRLGRELAMQYLFQLDLAGCEDFGQALENFWLQAEESGEFPTNRIFRKARNYAEKLISGVYEHESEIDEIIKNFSHDWALDRMAAVDRNILRVAIFELKYCEDIPALVSIDEAIEIAKDFSAGQSGTFINGILNGIKDSLPPGTKRPPHRRENDPAEN